MKKFLAILAALMLIPFTAFGMEMLSDNVMDDVTGQAGVSINLDVEVDATIATAAWGDADGVTGVAGEGGYVGMSNMTIDSLRVRARDDWALSGNPALIGQLQFLTIDVGSDALYGGTTYVRINPGTFQISMESFDATVALSDDTALDEVMGVMFMTDMDIFLARDNYIDIMAHGGSGVTIVFDMTMDTVTMATMGWGDLDGLENNVPYGVPSGTLPAYVAGDHTVAGYVGVANLAMANLTMSGTVGIDVVTLAADPTDPTSLVPGLYATWLAVNPGDASSTYVHMALSDVNVTLDSMTGDVQLGATAALGGGTLGDFYVGGVNATVNGWVDIFAH